MISSESSTISGERLRSTPSAPIEKRIALTERYQVTSGPSTTLLLEAGVVAEDDAADGGGEEHDRRHLEREQVIREEEASDLRRRAEPVRDLGLVRQASAGRLADRDDDLDEDGRRRADRRE